MSTRHAAAQQRRAAELDKIIASQPQLHERIRAVRQAFDGSVRFSTSLGIEDQVVLAGIAAAAVDIDVFVLDTGRHFPETLDTLEASETRYGRRIRLVVPDAAEVEALLGRDGVYGFRQSISARKACCEVRKVRPLRRALDGASGWVTGLRRGQAATRSDTPFAEYAPDFDLIKINPIADWSHDQVEAYVVEHDVPVSALHARGYPSIGCQPCTRAIAPGEDIRAGRWWWENERQDSAVSAFDGKECGLHSRPAQARGGMS